MAAAGAYEFIIEVRSGLAGWGLWLYAPAAAVGAICIAASRSVNLNDMFRPINAALIVGLALGGGLPARALSTRVATDLGKASYAMYILHVPLLWWYKRSWFHESGYLSQTVAAVVYLATVVILSAVVSQLIEEPWNRRIRAWAVVRTSGPLS
jgi:peptidoglycan/LPS O-acetylase OafA/YrhL